MSLKFLFLNNKFFVCWALINGLEQTVEIGILSIFELSIYLYYNIKGNTVCEITQKLIC